MCVFCCVFISYLKERKKKMTHTHTRTQSHTNGLLVLFDENVFGNFSRNLCALACLVFDGIFGWLGVISHSLFLLSITVFGHCQFESRVSRIGSNRKYNTREVKQTNKQKTNARSNVGSRRQSKGVGIDSNRNHLTAVFAHSRTFKQLTRTGRE